MPKRHIYEWRNLWDRAGIGRSDYIMSAAEKPTAYMADCIETEVLPGIHRTT
jgi:hypothetical protein